MLGSELTMIRKDAKALDGQWYPLPLCEYVLMCDGERGSGPEGADALCSAFDSAMLF